jgi:hypothetical protein
MSYEDSGNVREEVMEKDRKRGLKDKSMSESRW